MQLNRLKNISVDWVSLVGSPANGMGMILKSTTPAPPNQGGELKKEITFAKFDQERQVAYGIVYAPEVVDSQGDFTDCHEIEKAAYAFMRDLKAANVDVEHSENQTGAYICESWLVKSGDPWFDGMEGAWAVGIKVDDAAMWQDMKDGKITGLSMMGKAERDLVEKNEAIANEGFFKALVRSLKEALKSTGAEDDPPDTTEEEDMEKRLEAVEKAIADLPGTIQTAVADALKKSKEPGTPGPEPGDDLKKSLGEMKTGFEDFRKSIDDRLEAIEKSRQTGEHAPEDVKKSAVSDGIL